MQKTNRACISLFLFFLLLSSACVQKTRTSENIKSEPINHDVKKEGPQEIPYDEVVASPIEETERPRVGLFIGPGGAKSWAAIGVLRAFEKNNIPIEVIGGTEWGAFIAGLYAQKGKAHDTEWRASKIPSSLFKKGFLSTKSEPKNFSDAQKEISKIFLNEKTQTSKLKFICSTDSYRTQKSSNIYQGEWTEIMNYCVPYPPLFTTHKGWAASPIRFKSTQEGFVQQGANFIIYVNVMAGDSYYSTQAIPEGTKLLWQEHLKSLQRHSLSSFVINVYLPGTPYDLDSRKLYIQKGEEAGQKALELLKQQLTGAVN